MRYLVIAIGALATMACSPAAVSYRDDALMPSSESVGASTHESSMAAAMEFLLKSAAADFRAHPPAEGLRFHNVRIGYLPTAEGTRRYMLCGDFSSERGKGAGTPFVTIDSPGGPNGYQQLIGNHGMCDDPRATFGIAGDLSSALQSRFDSL